MPVASLESKETQDYKYISFFALLESRNVPLVEFPFQI